MATPSLIFLLIFTSTISLILSESFDYREISANLSTTWTLDPSLAHNNNISFSDGSTVVPLLLFGRAGFSVSLGFFCYAPCSTFLLSIYIIYTTNSTITNSHDIFPQVVWSANRNIPVNLNATLVFSSDGDLILRDADGSFVWSTNTSGHGAETLNILKSGNLVVLDGKKGQLWESFDHPTDCLSLGQSLRQGQRLTVKSSATNATGGQFYVEVLDDGLHAFIDSNPPQLYYSKTVHGSVKSENSSSFVTFSNTSLNMFTVFGRQGVPDYTYSLHSGFLQ